MRLDGPPEEELVSLARELSCEIEQELESDRWALIRTSSKVGHHGYAAAALRHVVTLLVDIVGAVEGQREAAAIILGRAHLEAWFIGTYLTLVGDSAVDRLYAGDAHSRAAQHKQLAESDRQLNEEIQSLERRNETIRSSNEGKRSWNAAHPDREPKALEPELPVPRRPPLNLDFQGDPTVGEDDLDLPAPEPLKVIDIARTLTKHARENEGLDGSLVLVYDLAYRGLSTLGAHPTMGVLCDVARVSSGRFAPPETRIAPVSGAVCVSLRRFVHDLLVRQRGASSGPHDLLPRPAPAEVLSGATERERLLP